MNEILVTNIRREQTEDHIRIMADVSYGNKSLSDDIYWIQVPIEFDDEVSLSGNPWLIMLLPVALTLRLPLRVDAPVDPQLYENVHQMMDQLTEWYPSLKPIEIHAPFEIDNTLAPDRNAAFFSLGIDSFYTILKNEPVAIEELITIRHTSTEFRAKMKESLEQAAHQLDKSLIFMETNIRQTNWKIVNWVHIGFVPFFVACAMVLEKRYRHVVIASMGVSKPVPHQHHPKLVPLWSTSSTHIEHQGSWTSRFDKLVFSVNSSVFKEHLKICWKSPDGNCGICEKCYRTKIGLELLGLREEVDIFDDDRFSAEMIKDYRIAKHNLEYYEVMLNVAQEKGRHDLAEGMSYLLEKSKQGHSLISIFKNPNLQNRFRRYPLLWNTVRPIAKFLLRR